jgi:hypothetical protein
VPSLSVVLFLSLCLTVVAFAQGPRAHAERQKLFVIAAGSSHKQALMAATERSAVRIDFESPHNAHIFSGEFTRGQARALSRLGARFEPVEEIVPQIGRERIGHLRGRPHGRGPVAHGKPICGDGRCHRRENPATCPVDCGGTEPGPGDGDPGDRTCLPLDQEDYPTLLGDGEVPLTAGAGVRLFVIDTGTTPGHPDLDVAVCRDVTGRKPSHGCDDSDGHGTHTSGSAAAYAGGDGLGLIGAAPGASLGVIKICDGACFADTLSSR